MAKVDNAEAIRDRAYAIWEREGRPSGREHEHWAEAAREFELEALTPAFDAQMSSADIETPEVDRLRRALYEPETFDAALSDDNAPPKAANSSSAKKKRGHAFG